jgi:hypothetical protein
MSTWALLSTVLELWVTKTQFDSSNLMLGKAILSGEKKKPLDFTAYTVYHDQLVCLNREYVT